MLSETYTFETPIGVVFFECPKCFKKSYFHDNYGGLMEGIIALYVKNENDDFLKAPGARESLIRALKRNKQLKRNKKTR